MAQVVEPVYSEPPHWPYKATAPDALDGAGEAMVWRVVGVLPVPAAVLLDFDLQLSLVLLDAETTGAALVAAGTSALVTAAEVTA